MEKDHAIIIGLQNYPGLGDPALSGPEYDAREFEKWALAESGGAVPTGNINRILSSDFPPPFASLMLTRPTELEIINAFEHLHTIFRENLKKGVEPKVGRRLYIYMSGHGIAPSPLGDATEESALLTSNVDPNQVKLPRYHIPGNYTATWFCRNDYFDEVLLFMDCCRDLTTVPFINVLFASTGTSVKAKKFCAFATKWSRRAREKSINGQMQGIFTKTLLLGLNGAAAERDPDDPQQGIITYESLQSYLVNNMKAFIDPQFRDDPKVQEPTIEYAAADKRSIIIRTALQKFPVTINPPPGATGEVGIFSALAKRIIQRIPVSDLPITVELPREDYALLAVVNGEMKDFMLPVTGIEGVQLKSDDNVIA